MILSLFITSLKLCIKFFSLVDNSVIMLWITRKVNDIKDMGQYFTSHKGYYVNSCRR